jgi:hypothetical protein
MATHLKVIAALFAIVGVVLIGVGLFATLIFGTLGGVVGASGDEDAGAAAAMFGLLGVAGTVLMLVLAVPYLVIGWGLWNRKSWARILGIIFAAMSLVSFPIGTMFGVYALIILFQKETEKLFADERRVAA